MKILSIIVFLFTFQALYSQNQKPEISIPDTLWLNGEYNEDGMWLCKPNMAYLEFEAQIYNRWGKLIHEQNTTLDTWTPSNNQFGTFYYAIRIKWSPSKEEKFSGNIFVVL